jgi:nucleoside-diphosphate-sugar epimerase
MKILVCGATGFIGRNITEALSRNPRFSVHAVSHESPQYLADAVTWHKADLRNPDDVETVMNGVDVVIQAAATTSGIKDIVNRPYIHVTDNAVMNSYLFRSAFEHRVRHVIFFSCTVMYPSSEEPLSEHSINANESLHEKYFGIGNTKLYLEKMCEFYGKMGETKFTAIRHSNIYGPYDKFDLEKSHVFGATLTKVMKENDRITVWGAGRESRDLLYVDDLIHFVLLVIEKQKSNYELLNCGSGKPISIRSLVEKIIGISGKHLDLVYDRKMPTIETSLSLDCDRALTLLGWSPRVSLDEGIQRTIKWWKEHYM